jgi:hypothetical protein
VQRATVELLDVLGRQIVVVDVDFCRFCLRAGWQSRQGCRSQDGQSARQKIPSAKSVSRDRIFHDHSPPIRRFYLYFGRDIASSDAPPPTGGGEPLTVFL